MPKAIFKYNNGIGALLCSGCNVIITTGNNMSEEEFKKAFNGEMDAQYCKDCEKPGDYTHRSFWKQD